MFSRQGGNRLRVVTGALAVSCAAASLATGAAAKSFHPTRLGDPSPGRCKPHDCSLREAISAANSKPGADRVVLRSGERYSLSRPGRGEDLNARGDLDVTGPLTIESSGRRRATIDAQRRDRALDAFANLHLARLVVRGGKADVDGFNTCGCGIRSSGEYPMTGESDLVVDRTRVIGNRDNSVDGGVGGGIAHRGAGDLIVRRSQIKRNSADVAGGGIFDGSSGDGRVSISRSTIAGNHGGYAGGFDEFGDDTAVKITNSRIVNNRADEAGGGIWIVINKLRLIGSTVSGNLSGSAGGGIFQRKSDLRIVRSTISGNRATGTNPGFFGARGGGLYALANGEDAKTTVIASTISGNRAGLAGGGIVNRASDGSNSQLALTNSTVAGNRAADYGGGIDNSVDASGNATVALNSVTVARNDANSNDDAIGQGGGLQNGTGSGSFTIANSVIALNRGVVGRDCAGFPFASAGGNLFTSLSGCTINSASGDATRAAPKLAPLSDNGGPTRTVALKRGSPAIGRARASAPPHDQRGVSRHDPDAGAFERR